MIADEVICGFGRLGTPFGSQALGFRPDGISVAKALSSGYAPIAAVLVPEPMYEALLTESRKIGTFGHGFTYSGHPVAAAVALKTLEIYARDRASRGKSPAITGPASRARRASPGRRGARNRADRRGRAGCGQADQAIVRPRVRRRRTLRALCRGQRADRSRGRRRRGVDLSAARHHDAGDRRAVRS